MAVYKTVQRKILLDFLEMHKEESFTVKEIASGISDICPDSPPSESTIYRLMRELSENGTVSKDVDVRSRENVYRLASAGESGLHLRCRVCGNVYNVDSESCRKIRDEISKCGAALTEDNIEFIIKCRNCK